MSSNGKVKNMPGALVDMCGKPSLELRAGTASWFSSFLLVQQAFVVGTPEGRPGPRTARGGGSLPTCPWALVPCPSPQLMEGRALKFRTPFPSDLPGTAQWEGRWQPWLPRQETKPGEGGCGGGETPGSQWAPYQQVPGRAIPRVGAAPPWALLSVPESTGRSSG